ncbi:LysM peptidoglycan-binding domain-containing protein [Anaerobacillus alkaliphilus]|uniref:LysM peptidoglycan-binding domain-containing protein n=1 Tax=Anaerobacillus alkaliphilus TaxID=1548597 RepID=A0A4Q0VRP9_9BACI|nr:LysM peptidoglycan-binding domain-containing protein [Anaerobacillus alkaliphilus]RXJ00264.1 LysM peptidoglycan-binding domain-containing protein [Anaerobacillus alkaliphilus]
MKKATRIIAPILGVSLVFGAIGVSAHETVTVKSGDTYWGIAQKYDDVTTEDLMEANEYNAYAIPTGAEITVPTENVVTHVIQPGNTLAEIAAAYDGVTVNDLVRLNPEIDPYHLEIGSEIVIVNYDSVLGEDYLYHTIQPGNTFYNIANAYDGVSVNDLLEANPNEDPYELTIGSQIVIPLN